MEDLKVQADIHYSWYCPNCDEPTICSDEGVQDDGDCIEVTCHECNCEYTVFV